MRASTWLSELHAADQRRFVNLLAGSFVAHALFVGLLALSPARPTALLPDVLRVDLVAALPAPARAPEPRAKAAPAPPPKSLPKQVVLPKKAPRAVPRKPAPAPAPRRAESLEYDDALSQLRNDLGEATPTRAEPQPQVERSAPPASEPGVSIDRDVAAWVIATQRHVRSRYITPPEFLNRSLATGLEVLLTSGGELVGMPTVVRPSGDPFFDDNALRAVMTSAPLPPPPRPGSYTFVFTSEGR